MALLETNDVSVRFGGVQAIGEVSLSVVSGCVTGLIGPNGAGKTTLLNVLTGLQFPGRGRVLLDGKDITRASPSQRNSLGIARTFQRLELFDVLTCVENVLVATEVAMSRSTRAPLAEAERLLDLVGLADVADVRADELPTGRARLLELARALATVPRVLLLDEPASGLNEMETSALSDLLRVLAGDGLTVLLVEHDIAMVVDVCQHIAVLDMGTLIAMGGADDIRQNPLVVDAYLGTHAHG